MGKCNAIRTVLWGSVMLSEQYHAIGIATWESVMLSDRYHREV